MSLRKLIAGTGGVTLIGVSLTSFIPASASEDECTSADPNAVKIDDGVCEVTFTEDGTWTPPANVSPLEALLVGAGFGGESNGAYAGAGGSVELVTDLSSSAPISVTIGTGSRGKDYGFGFSDVFADIDNPQAREPFQTRLEQNGTEWMAEGGFGYLNSGHTPTSTIDVNSNGGGANGLPTSTTVGPGKRVSDFPERDLTLWPDASDLCFGEGGSGNSASNGSIECGGGAHVIVEPASFSGNFKTLSGTGMDAAPNSGGGGGAFAASSFFSASGDGADGIVIFRFELSEESAEADGPESAGDSFSAPSPFQGPVITDVGADNTVSPFPTSIGNNVRVLGQNLAGVSSVLVNGIDTELVSVSENSFVFTVPEGLESGTYDLTVVSGGQNVQVQEPLVIGDGLSIEEAAAICDGQAPTVWTQRISVTQAKAYIKCGTPGVSYRVSVQQNGSGPYDTVITRTLTDIYDDRQLFNTVGRYVVRTIDLTERTRIRIYSDEEKLWQVVYNKDSFGG